MDKPVSRPRRQPSRRGRMAINRLSLHEQVAERLREMIVSGELEPGRKVPFAQLSAQLDVSLTPLREALKVLAEEQLVELTPNRGARVVPVTVEDTRMLFEAISGIESLAAELAAERMTPDELAVLEDVHARMRGHFDAGEKDAYFQLNREIHDLIVDYAHNPIFARLRSKLAVRAERVRFIAVAEGHGWPQAMQDHEDIMAAFRARDPRRAQAIWRQHLIRSGEQTCAVLAKN